MPMNGGQTESNRPEVPTDVPNPQPTQPQLNPFQQVIIDHVENGFVIRVGCKNFVSRSLIEIFDGLNLYYKNPGEARKKYCGIET